MDAEQPNVWLGGMCDPLVAGGWGAILRIIFVEAGRICRVGSPIAGGIESLAFAIQGKHAQLEKALLHIGVQDGVGTHHHCVVRPAADV